jgi:hypothetical protein
MIEQAMRIVENAASTAITGSTSRKSCIRFRPKSSSDKVFLKIQYGTGCSASVTIYSLFFSLSLLFATEMFLIYLGGIWYWRKTNDIKLQWLFRFRYHSA